ncbi:23S rRNA (adenine(2030)-N(6))-methyltransferase RlmJ [Reinekea blandensis]|uniref:Ribosomal RNA large subunit methyltransferase J n=1 Tax=Reinekea blandensis MED297 TaxID=314283 RepID=A4BBB1_9GAMM|nr:23S rRNA (adenine(2030)-N(6))-methyltransferase RlmJ [Reinekea blandensis]EAR10724.1 hypothetical protein MED297_11930 [Reinekea sp. MED297] [Reinekea blandensis MED297]
MLSYRHSYHAGNVADLIKHIVLVEMLSHLVKKETPFDYIDTHSGAGLYDLRSAQAQKTQEHIDGIQRLKPADYPELKTYFDIIRHLNKSSTIDFYPGSPLVAKHFIRPHDRGWLFELHPDDSNRLQKNFVDQKNIRVQPKDGYEGLNAVFPPKSKRGLVLIDPSYEVKAEYEWVAQAVMKAHGKFRQGIYAIWYPVVDRPTIQRLEKTLMKSGIRNIQRFELGVAPDSDTRGMTASGMIVINPPWTLFETMSNLLPRLAKDVTQTGGVFYKCDTLVVE